MLGTQKCMVDLLDLNQNDPGRLPGRESATLGVDGWNMWCGCARPECTTWTPTLTTDRRPTSSVGLDLT